MIQPAQEQVQQLVEAQPTSFTFLVGEAIASDGRKLNVIEIHSVIGVLRFFCYPEDAEKLAEHWLNTARGQKSKLILPSMPVVQSVNGHKIIEGT